jgi:DNA mismatch endonuclease, patch repair protein
MARAPRYEGLTPRSARASAAARGSSKKANTKPEILLRRALWLRGFRYRTNGADLPGRPDIVLSGARLVVFVDGDFWHGKTWTMRKAKLARGHNADYWISKIQRNMKRDRQRDRELSAAGWLVLRAWESEIHADLDRIVRHVESAIRRRRPSVASSVNHRAASLPRAEVIGRFSGATAFLSVRPSAPLRSSKNV